jgi:hypothetical protein
MPSKGGSRVASVANPATAGPASAVVAAALGGGGVAAFAGNDLESVAFTAVEEATSALAIEEEPAVETPQWADLYARAVEATARDRERIEREQQEAQRLWEEFLRVQGEEVPEGDRSLVDNDDLHRQLQRLARTSAAAEYERENVIGDPNQTFGVEIEFDGADPHAVARAFYEAGLAATPNMQGYHSGARVPGKWVVERDSTVTGEIVSPVMQDTPESWDQLERVCQILRAHGARTTTRTGGHVHVGADSANLDHDVNRFRRVASVCAWAEDLMYRLAAGTGRAGRQHRGAGNGYRWCGPMGSGQFENAQDLSELAYRVGSSHGVGLNYGNILEHRRTIEYRYFDSSLDPARLQANIKLACWVTKRAAELPDSAIPRERVRLGTHRSAPESDQNDGLLRRFADMVFVRPKDKLKLYWLYEHSAWQRSRAAA